MSARGVLGTALVLAAAACGGDGDGGTGPLPEATLRERALAAGLEPMPLEPVRPADNDYAPARVALGHLLFFDPVLSGPGDVACSTCHLPRLAFADGRQFPVGAGGLGLGPDRVLPEEAQTRDGLREMPRNSPPVTNTGLYGSFRNADPTEPVVDGVIFWGGNAFSLENQALAPITADNELRGVTFSKLHAVDSVTRRLRAIPAYVDAFASAYPEIEAAWGLDAARLIDGQGITLKKALAAYMRELVTPRAPLDDYLRGDDGALGPAEKRGLELFIGDAGCVDCHRGPLLSDFTMHVLGTRQEGLGRDTTQGDDLGWGEHGGTPYAFRTPPLRQVALTAPYFHAGTAVTLLDVLRFKNRGRSEHAAVGEDRLDPAVRPLGLSEAQLADLAAFLGALTDETTPAQNILFDAPPEVPSGLEIPK